MSKFNIENQYKLYLQRMKLDESKMPTVQRVETKRVFYGAFGQLLMLLQNDISALSDDEAFKTLDNMITQVGQFFMNETHKQN
tara:strand:+ start:5669 stop:5917 length:249 start_codon:yes stop_codon:yes gene_type:complete